MPSLLALIWRCLLILGLVFNPVVGMGMVGVAQAAEHVSTAAKAPPCHEGVAMQMQASTHEAGVPCQHDGSKNCGHITCKSGACCLAGALDLPAPAIVPAQHGVEAVHSYDLSVAATPPPSRMIRPPIG